MYGLGAYDGQLFASFYTGQVFRVDAATFTINGSPLSLPDCVESWGGGPYGGQSFDR